MAPLVPDIISNEFNLIIAFVIGIFFGLALEQAGFSSTRKLVGLFYGYDFTVLKVFFTAGVTAMVGVLLMTHLGMLDMRMVYVNPTFLWSAIVGGLIMGAGFIVGGFCPGTSLCAAAVGKLDAWSFIGGSLFGILAFTEGYPLIKDLYLAGDMGSVTIYDMLNLSRDTFAVLLIAIAVAAFYFTGLIEDKINGLQSKYPAQKMIRYALVAVAPFLLVSFVAITPNQKEFYLGKVEKALALNTVEYNEYDLDHLTDELVHQAHKFNLIDLRNPEVFKEFSIPTAVNVPLDSMLKKEYRHLFRQKYKMNVFYADDETIAKKGYLLADLLGNSQNYVLLSSSGEFKKWFYEPELPVQGASKNERDLFKFRLQKGMELKQLEERLKNLSQPVKKVVKKVQGGCA
jgi:rhodanese-related sulfurtransferase